MTVPRSPSGIVLAHAAQSEPCYCRTARRRGVSEARRAQSARGRSSKQEGGSSDATDTMCACGGVWLPGVTGSDGRPLSESWFSVDPSLRLLIERRSKTSFVDGVVSELFIQSTENTDGRMP